MEDGAVFTEAGGVVEVRRCSGAAARTRFFQARFWLICVPRAWLTVARGAALAFCVTMAWWAQTRPIDAEKTLHTRTFNSLSIA